MMNKEPERSMHRSRTLFYLFAFACAIAYIFYLACAIAFIFYAHPGAAQENDEGGVVVQISDGGFEPKSVEVSAGDTVVFENVDQKPHWPASDPHPTHTEYPGFDPKKPVEPGSEWSFTFDKPGDWTYHDHQAPYLKGEIVVDDGESAASGGRDQTGGKSGIGGLLASITGFLFDTYKATASAFASEDDGAASNEPNELSREQFEAAKAKYVALVQDQDPKVALDQLQTDIQTDDNLSRSCHAVVHEIGHAAYKKYDDFGEAMKYLSEMCNSGYLHGIIESRFAESEDVFTDMQTLCNPYPPKSFLNWQCYHGLGHGLMYYTANDLPKSLEMCDTFKSRTDSSNCTNGVFMENFSADQKLHLSDYLKESDPFYPCAEQIERHKRNCYTYAPTYYLSLNKNDYVGALEWCKGAEASFVSTCAFGVGAQTMKENVNDPESVESICMNADAELVASCIKGMVDLYANHQGAVKPVEQLCADLQASNRPTCYDTLKKYYTLFDS
jgi:plastocyanin